MTPENEAKMKMINSLWAQYDTDGSGELNYRESMRFIKDVVGGIPDEVFLHVFNSFDKDNSGTIGKHEMIDFMSMITGEADGSQ